MANRKRKFLVTGYKNMPNEKISLLLHLSDLGIVGAYQRFSDEVAISIDDDIKPEQLQRQPDAIKSAYEAAGIIEVEVKEQ